MAVSLRRPMAAAVATLTTLGAACGDDASPAVAAPLVGDIEPALDAFEAAEGRADYFEVSATLEFVRIVAAEPDLNGGTEAVVWLFDDGELSGPEALGAAEGATFDADQISVDPEHIFDGIREELDDPVITDFAIVSAGDTMVYDATVLSDSGGVLGVRLAPDGSVVGVQSG